MFKKKSDKFQEEVQKQARKAPSYASSKLRLTDLPTGVKCRATSVAKNRAICFFKFSKIVQQLVMSRLAVQRTGGHLSRANFCSDVLIVTKLVTDRPERKKRMIKQRKMHALILTKISK